MKEEKGTKLVVRGKDIELLSRAENHIYIVHRGKRVGMLRVRTYHPEGVLPIVEYTESE